MNTNSIYLLKAFRKLYTHIFKRQQLPELKYEENTDNISEMIYNLLSKEEPCMIARLGATELMTIVYYIGVKQNKRNWITYIKGKSLGWWWESNVFKQMERWSGFFPPTKQNIEKFCKLIIENAPQVDILGSWQKNEYYLSDELKNALKIQLMYLDPYWSKEPWSRVLANKNILVIHPFAETIQSQYLKREYLFKNPNILPPFKTLTVIKAVQSLGGENNGFKDWFEALEYMKGEIDKCEFDICLIGCGAYGFPLAAHVKRIGKKAIHMGGSLQLLFGIMGNRWDHDVPHYEKGIFIHYAGLENEYWVRPNKNERPSTHQAVEGSCYW